MPLNLFSNTPRYVLEVVYERTGTKGNTTRKSLQDLIFSLLKKLNKFNCVYFEPIELFSHGNKGFFLFAFSKCASCGTHPLNSHTMKYMNLYGQ